MFRRMVFSAVAAGLIAGLAVAVLNHLVTVPLILHAETFEASVPGGPAAPAHALGPTRVMTAAIVINVDEAAPHSLEGWHPADGLERSAFTFMTTALLAIGFSLALLGGMVLAGVPIGPHRALMWGLAGFAAFILAPGLGLPPELPGASAASVESRQVWWTFTVVATLAGIAALAFAHKRPALAPFIVAAGLIAIVLPHLVGAPHPPRFESRVPAEISAHFASASIAVNAVMWVLIGWLSGYFYSLFAPAGAETADG